METEREWIKIDEIKEFGKETITINCDTRTFSVCTHEKPITLIEEDDPYYIKFNKLFRKIMSNDKFDEKYLISYDEIIPFINHVRNIRDKYKMIVIRFNIEECKYAWLKYIRFYRVSDGRYIVTNNGIPFNWRNVNEETLYKD